MLSLEDHSPSTVGVGYDTIADFETGGAQRIRWDGDLMLGTDPRGASTAVLYLSHKCKGIGWIVVQPFRGPEKADAAMP